MVNLISRLPPSRLASKQFLRTSLNTELVGLSTLPRRWQNIDKWAGTRAASEVVTSQGGIKSLTSTPKSEKIIEPSHNSLAFGRSNHVTSIEIHSSGKGTSLWWEHYLFNVGIVSAPFLCLCNPTYLFVCK